MAIAANRWDRDDLLLYLKTRLAGVAADDVALLENYLIEHCISHIPWHVPWNWIDRNLVDTAASGSLPLNARVRLERVNQAREKVNGDLAVAGDRAGRGRFGCRNAGAGAFRFAHAAEGGAAA